MAHKVFVSYKFNDSNVKQIGYTYYTTPRDYVDIIQREIGDDRIYRGEQNNSSMADESDEYIWKSLKDRIFYTSVTIVLVSPHMRDNSKKEEEQWIPREIRYSLYQNLRNDSTSSTNGILAVMLPDMTNNYKYQELLGFRPVGFTIMLKNRNNVIPLCRNIAPSKDYIYTVEWKDFIKDIDRYIDIAYNIQQHQELYNIYKEIK